MLLDDALARVSVWTEPGVVSGRSARDTLNVRVGIAGVFLGVPNGGFGEHLIDIRATRPGFPFVADAGNGEVTREFNPGNFLNSGVKVLGGAIRIYIGEQA